MHIIKHYLTITRHRHMVMNFCFRSGLIWQGLLHDLSKYSPTEFFRGAKYYQGTYSPNANERKAKGYSLAWMHHKGRNKHHYEYWVDVTPHTHKYSPVPMPDRYIAESICDRIAATKVYNKKDFKRTQVLDYFMHEKPNLDIHPDTLAKLEFLINYYVEHGDKETFKYLKKNMRGK